MFYSLPTWWLAVIASMASAAALGQPLAADAHTPPPRADLNFRSALEGYQPFKDEKPIPWLQANETVYSRGGWRAYAKEASGSGAVGTESSKTGEPASSEQSDRSQPKSAMPGMSGMSGMPAQKDKP